MDLNIGAKLFLAKAEKVFLRPNPLYSYDEIIKGCSVEYKNGEKHIMSAIDGSVWRGLHISRKVQNEIGPKSICIDYFINNKLRIIDNLKNVSNSNELNEFSNQLYSELYDLLKQNIKENMLVYNRVRLPIDLAIEHVVAMSKELDNCRRKLIPLLFIPLDKPSLRYAFEDYELKKENFDDISSIGDVDSSLEYDKLQNKLQERTIGLSKKLGVKYYRIYIELLWHDRHENWGENLFQTNLKLELS